MGRRWSPPTEKLVNVVSNRISRNMGRGALKILSFTTFMPILREYTGTT